MEDEMFAALREALDDSVLTHTGRSIGDVASQRVMDDLMPIIEEMMARERRAMEMCPPGPFAVFRDMPPDTRPPVKDDLPF